MLLASEGLHCPLLLLFLLLHPVGSADVEDAAEEQVEVVTDSSPCSATCGLGFKTQTLCLLRDDQRATEEEPGSKDGTEVSEECRVHKVTCQELWQCGLRTLTVTSGQRLEVDCLGDVMKAMGSVSWRVSWRFARGIISSDDSLFARWKPRQLHRLILDPVREEDAGTYLCEVQDGSFRRVKRVYWGVRVLPAGILDLDN
ncbi:transmembrane protein 81 [Platichthys flesus]|uniref:transmembrane protein 81 n=1 Tax=Platichthys flesus TaxID=8260 RepID=UPI002DB5D1EB|nr:transmembrane protein 81 [Platichthys flesus]